MAEMAGSMINAMGVANTTTYFVNGVSGMPQEFGKMTVAKLCTAITERDLDTFSDLFLNLPLGNQTASLSFPIGTAYTDLPSAWSAVDGAVIRLNGQTHSAGLFTAAPVQIQLKPGVLFQSAIIRMEFETIDHHFDDYLLKSIEFFWDF